MIIHWHIYLAEDGALGVLAGFPHPHPSTSPILMLLPRPYCLRHVTKESIFLVTSLKMIRPPTNHELKEWCSGAMIQWWIKPYQCTHLTLVREFVNKTVGNKKVIISHTNLSKSLYVFDCPSTCTKIKIFFLNTKFEKIKEKFRIKHSSKTSIY